MKTHFVKRPGVSINLLWFMIVFFLPAGQCILGQFNQLIAHPGTRHKSVYESIHLLDSIIVERYNQTTGQWAQRYKEEYNYSTGGRLLQMIYGSWMKTEGDRHKYKVDFTYDATGNLIMEMGWRWDTITVQWLNNYMSENTYDANGNRIIETSYFWHSDDSLWFDDYIYEYAYDENGYMTQESYKFWDEYNNKWQYYSRFDYTNDENGNCTQFNRFKWDDISDKWVISYHYEYIFDENGHEIQLLVSAWDTILHQGIPDTKHDYSWDGNGNMIRDLYYTWDTITGQWENYKKYDYTYDVNGNVSRYTYDMWNKDISDWTYFDRAFKYYSLLDITGTYGNELSEINVWPNPASDYLIFDIDESGAVKVVIYDMQGRKVLARQLDNSKPQVPVSHLNNGIYLYVIYGSKMYSGKVVIRR